MDPIGFVLPRICAHRTDANAGWGLHLVIQCLGPVKEPILRYHTGDLQQITSPNPKP